MFNGAISLIAFLDNKPSCTLPADACKLQGCEFSIKKQKILKLVGDRVQWEMY